MTYILEGDDLPYIYVRGDGGTRPPGIDDTDYDPWSPAADDALPVDQSFEWDGYDAPLREPPTKLPKKGEWKCPEHGPLCNPDICKERASYELAKRLQEERERREKENLDREVKRAKALKKERKKADVMAEGPRSGRSGSNSDGDVLRDEGTIPIARLLSHTNN